MSRSDERTRFVGLSEFEACLGPGEGPLITPGRIGRGQRWRAALRPPLDWQQERRMWRDLRRDHSLVATLTAAPDAEPDTLLALGRLAEAVYAMAAQEQLGELDDGGPYCPICGAELERVDCDSCGGEGGRDSDELMSEDPLWYDGVDWEDCADCRGQGAFWECPNAPHEGV